MSIKEPTYSDKNLFATTIHDFPILLDSYFEACDALKRQTDLFLRNAASSILPSEIVDMEDARSARREVYEKADPFVTALKQLIDMIGENDRWFMTRMEEVERVDREGKQ